MDVGGRASHELLTPAEVTAARGLIGGLNYVTTQSRSGEAVSVSQASGNLSENPVIGVLRALNRIRSRLQAEQLVLTFPLFCAAKDFQIFGFWGRLMGDGATRRKSRGGWLSHFCQWDPLHVKILQTANHGKCPVQCCFGDQIVCEGLLGLLVVRKLW